MDLTDERIEAYLNFYGIPPKLNGAACLDLSELGTGLSLALQKRGAAQVVSPRGWRQPNNMKALAGIAGPFDYIFAFMDLFFDSDLEQLKCLLRSSLKEDGRLAIESTLAGSLFEKRWTATVVDGTVRIVPTFAKWPKIFFRDSRCVILAACLTARGEAPHSGLSVAH